MADGEYELDHIDPIRQNQEIQFAEFLREWALGAIRNRGCPPTQRAATADQSLQITHRDLGNGFSRGQISDGDIPWRCRGT